MRKLKHIFLLLLCLITFTTGNTQTLPTDISDLLVWFDAQDSTLNLGAVSQWNDMSGNGHDLIQIEEEKQPFIIENGMGGKRMLSFNGINNYLKTQFPTSIQTPMTIFTLLNSESTDFQYLFNAYSNYNNAIRVSSNTGINYFTNPGGISYEKTLPFDYILVTFQVDEGNSFIRENTEEKVSGNIPLKYLNGITLGARHEGTSSFFQGNIGDFIIYSRALNEEEILSIEGFIMDKYQPPVNLQHNVVKNNMCDSLLTLNALYPIVTWSDGTNDTIMNINESGEYWVSVEDYWGRVSSDTIYVVYNEFQYPDNSNYCPNESVDWNTNLSNNSFSFEWYTPSDNNIISTSNQLTISTPQDIYVTVTDTFGCVFTSDTLYFTEDTFSSTASLGGNTDLCVGNTLALSTGAEEAVSYLWSTGETTPQIEISTSGSYSVTVENANGCVAEDEVTINILGDAPVIQFFTPEISCVDAGFAFEDLSYTVDGSDVDSWEWQFTDSTSINSATGVYTYDSAGVYTVHYTVGTSVGCFNDSTFTIEVKDNPILDFSTQNSCQTDEIQFNGGQLSPTTIDTWEWNFGDEDSGAANTSTEQITTHHFTNSGTFDVQLVGIDIFGCIDTLVNQKIIDAAPVVDFNYNDACEGNIVYFENQTAIGDSAEISGYQWNFGDGNTSGQTNPNKPYVTHGEYMVSLIAIADNGCSDTLTQLVKIHANPQVDYIMEQPCAGITTVFQDNSFVPNGSVADVDWEFNGGTPINGLAIEKNFNNGGSYNLKQTVKSAFGCNNSKETTVNIHDLIHAGFTVSPNNFVVDEEIVFTSNSIGATSYAWTFGDFATSQQADTSLVFTDEQIGDEIGVTLTVSNEFDCQDSTHLSKTVLGRETDLALSQLFVDEVDGFLKIGVRLKNNGFTPIEKVELTVYRAGIGAFKDTWTGMLNAGESEVYVLNTSPSATVSMQQEQHNYICVNGKLLNNTFEEEDLSNNEVCLSLSKEDLVLLRPFPNPVDDWLNLRLLNTKELTGSLYIYNNQGQMVYAKKDFLFQVGVNDLKIDTKSWSSGSYTIRFVGNVEVPSVRFVKR